MKLLYDKISFENDRAGIYRIDCIASGKFYIGSSKYLYRRFKDHSSYLRKGKHCNQRLQRSYDKYGPENFTYTVLVVLPSEDRDFIYHMEQKFIDTYSPELNIVPEVGMPAPPKKEVARYDIQGKLVEVLPSLVSAEEKYGAKPSGIRSAALDPWRVCAGHRWRYVEDGVVEESLEPLKNILLLDTKEAHVTKMAWKYGEYTIYQWSKSGDLLSTWASIEEALAYIGKGSIVGFREHLRGRLGSYYGHVWTLDPMFPGYTEKNADKRVAIRLEKSGEILDFPSYAAAGLYFGASTSAVRLAKNRGYTFRGWTITVLDKADTKPSSEDVEAS